MHSATLNGIVYSKFSACICQVTCYGNHRCQFTEAGQVDPRGASFNQVSVLIAEQRKFLSIAVFLTLKISVRDFKFQANTQTFLFKVAFKFLFALNLWCVVKPHSIMCNCWIGFIYISVYICLYVLVYTGMQTSKMK